MAEGNTQDYRPVIASSNRYLDIEPYCGRIYNTENQKWRDILPWEFPQSADKDVEEAFLRNYFSEREIYIQGGDYNGYRFLKQVWYCIALWNYQIKIPKVADAWMLNNQNIINDAALRGHLLSPEAEVSAFFAPKEIFEYGEKLLGQAIGLIQYRVTQLTVTDHPWHTASQSNNATDLTSSPAKATPASQMSANNADSAVSDTQSESSSTTRSSRMQQAGLALTDRPVASLSPVPEDTQRPRAESSTQPQPSPVHVRKRGSSFSRVQQNTTRSGSFMLRPQQQYPHGDMHQPKQFPPFNSAGPTIGDVPPYTAQQQGRLSSCEHAHPTLTYPHTTQVPPGLPGSAAPPNIIQQMGAHMDLVNGPPPPSGYLSPLVEPRDFRHTNDEQYSTHRFNDGRLFVQSSFDDKPGTSKHANNRRDSYSARGSKPRTISNSRGKPYNGRNSFSSGQHGPENFFQGSGDARYTPNFVPEGRRRHNSSFSNDWRANAQNERRHIDENLPPTRRLFDQPGVSFFHPSRGLRNNTADLTSYTPTPGHIAAPSQQGVESSVFQGQDGIKHVAELGHDPRANTAYTIAPGCTYITRLLVLDVPLQMTEADVRMYFQTVGPVHSVSLNRKYIGSAPKTMCWITFGDHQTTVEALSRNGTFWSGNERLHIQVPREYWDPAHDKFPGSDHPENRRPSIKPFKPSFKPFKNSTSQSTSSSQPTYTSQDVRCLNPVTEVDTAVAEGENEPDATKEVLSSSTTPNDSGPSTPKKKSKSKKGKNREQLEDVPTSVSATKAVPKATSTAEHVNTAKEVVSDQTTSTTFSSKASSDSAKDETSAHLSAHHDENQHAAHTESAEIQARQSQGTSLTSSVILPPAIKESQGADISPQQPFRAQTPSEAQAAVSGSTSTGSAGPTKAIPLDSNEGAIGSSSGAEGNHDTKVIAEASELVVPATASTPTTTPLTAQKHDDDGGGVDESFHTAIESDGSMKQQKGADQLTKSELSTAEPSHTADEPPALLSVRGRWEDRGTDETSSSAVTAVTTIHSEIGPYHSPVPATVEQSEQPSAEDGWVASSRCQTTNGEDARSRASVASKKVPIPLLMVNRAVSVHTDDDASPKIDDLPTPKSVTSPTSPATPAATADSSSQHSRKSSSTALPLPPKQTKVEKLKGPAKTESLSMFAKKQQTSKPKKAKPQKGKDSIRTKSLIDDDSASSKPSPSGSRAASIAANASPQDVLDQDVTGADRASIDTVMESTDTQSAGPLANSTSQSAQGVGGIPRQRSVLQSLLLLNPFICRKHADHLANLGRQQFHTVPGSTVVDNPRAGPTYTEPSNKSPESKSDLKQSHSADTAKGAASPTDESSTSSRGPAHTATTGSGGSGQTLFQSFRESDAAVGVRDRGDSGGAVRDQTGGNGAGVDSALPDAGMTDDETPPVYAAPDEGKPKKKSRKSGNKKKKGKSKANDNREKSVEVDAPIIAGQTTISTNDSDATTTNQPKSTRVSLTERPKFMFTFGEDQKSPSTPYPNKTEAAVATAAEGATLSPTAVSATSSHTFGRPSDTSGDNTPSSTAAASSSTDSPSTSRVQSLLAARQQQLKSGSSGLVTAAPNRNVMAKRQHTAHKKRVSKSSDSSSSATEGEAEERQGEGETGAVTAGDEGGSRPRAYILRTTGLPGTLDSVLDAMRAYRGQGGPGTVLFYDATCDEQDADASQGRKKIDEGEAEGEEEDNEGWTGMIVDVNEVNGKRL